LLNNISRGVTAIFHSSLLINQRHRQSCNLFEITATQTALFVIVHLGLGITALHNAVCAGHTEIVKFLVQFAYVGNSLCFSKWTWT
uniref:Uncharacterized protein n=1 Tax=Maylandia zebra TaxID=106582 RepID=A0A3P9B363_9CICH